MTFPICLASDSDRLPKNPIDKILKWEQDDSSCPQFSALRSSVTSCPGSRALVPWIQKFMDKYPLPPKACSDFRRVFTAAFVADASMNPIQFSACSRATGAAVKRSTSLNYWDVDAASSNDVVSLHFQGD